MLINVPLRSQIEQRYGKEMCQLANSMIGRDEFGTLHNGLEVLQSGARCFTMQLLLCIKLSLCSIICST